MFTKRRRRNLTVSIGGGQVKVKTVRTGILYRNGSTGVRVL